MLIFTREEGEHNYKNNLILINSKSKVKIFISCVFNVKGGNEKKIH